MEKEVCQLAYTGNFEQFKIKVSSFPDLVNKSDESGRSPVHWAASGGHTEIVKFLLDQPSINVDHRDESNWTSLMIAVSAGREPLVQSLIAHGAQVNAVNSTGQCSLHYAASKDRFKIAEMLLEHGADTNVSDRNGHTPLHRAATKGHTKLTKLLLSYSADPNHQDREGNSPLHFACEDDQIEESKLLVEHGASLTTRNKAEKTPKELATPRLRNQLERLRGSEEIPR